MRNSSLWMLVAVTLFPIRTVASPDSLSALSAQAMRRAPLKYSRSCRAEVQKARRKGRQFSFNLAIRNDRVFDKSSPLWRDLIPETIAAATKQGHAIMVANSEVIHAAGQLGKRSKLFVVDNSERGMDALKFVLNETQRFRSVDKWRASVNRSCRSNSQLRQSSTTALKELLDGVGPREYRNIRRSVAAGKVIFRGGDWKQEGLGNRLARDAKGPFSLVYVSNIPEYLYPSRWNTYLTPNTATNNPEHFFSSVLQLTGKKTTVIYGKAYDAMQILDRKGTEQVIEQTRQPMQL